MKLVFEHLAAACTMAPTAARDGMAMGAYYGGLAINQVNVGSVHAIAHQLGGKYGIPMAWPTPWCCRMCWSSVTRKLRRGWRSWRPGRSWRTGRY